MPYHPKVDMKRLRLLHLFLGVNVSLAFWHIFRYNLITHASYQTQKLSGQHRDLITHKQELMKCLCVLRSQQEVYDFARTHLNMHTMRLDQIHTVNNDNQAV